MLQFLIYLIPLVGIGALAIGFAAMFAPIKMSGIFGVQISGAASAFVVGMGVRDLFIGGAILILYFLDLPLPAAWMLSMLGGVALSDFIVVRMHGSKLISLTHLMGAILVTGLAGVLLYLLP